jgi:hypothetical protein
MCTADKESEREREREREREGDVYVGDDTARVVFSTTGP